MNKLVIHLLSIIAQINNSQNPLDPDIFFGPDGDEVAVTPTLLPFNSDILPGETAEFEFPLSGSRNWSFLYSFMFDGDLYTDLLASTVPEPNSLGLLLAGDGALLILRRKLAVAAPTRQNELGVAFGRICCRLGAVPRSVATGAARRPPGSGLHRNGAHDLFLV